MITLISGGRGLIGSAIAKHLGPGVVTYDLPEGFPPADTDYDAFIDCARYDHQLLQMDTWNEVIENFKRWDGGKIIFFSSIYGHKAPDFGIYYGTEIAPPKIQYAMEKAAVEQATRYYAEYLKPWGIQVNCIAPGGVCNNHSERFQQEYFTSGNADMILTKNLFPVVDMLLHEDNAVNGQVITVDGGWRL